MGEPTEGEKNRDPSLRRIRENHRARHSQCIAMQSIDVLFCNRSRFHSPIEVRSGGHALIRDQVSPAHPLALRIVQSLRGLVQGRAGCEQGRRVQRGRARRRPPGRELVKLHLLQRARNERLSQRIVSVL
jgi:hypothetical protein